MINNIDDILYKVEKPARYVGGEYNSFEKNIEDVDLRFAFCFPDVYEVGMSHLGMKILYYTLNKREDTFCERAFAPWVDMEKELRERNENLFTLETKSSLKDFDFVGFTLQYEMSYTNILNMLDLGGITIRSSKRGEDEPIVIMGGPCANNPETLYDIADIFSIGEGEEHLNEILDLYKECKAKGMSRQEFLREASKIESTYVPSMYEVKYNDDNTIASFEPKFDDVPKTVKRRVVYNFNDIDFPDKLIVPYTEIVHDRIMIETMRGCTRGCRFCQAGMIYRPVREKSVETISNYADKLLKSTGYEEVSLTSLSICDYSDVNNLVMSLVEKYQDDKVGVSLPSLRIDSFSVDLINEIQKVRKTGLTFAPEAGSQRMRDVINKGVNEEDLTSSVSAAFKNGWSTIKLYFMVGLPYETIEDVKGIAHLGDAVCAEYYAIPKPDRKKGLRVNLSTSIFVPKPHTPFQWAPMCDLDTIRERIRALRGEIKSRAISYSWHETLISYMEAVIARGDRRVCESIIRAYEKGSKMDGWSQYFDYDLWMEAFKECNVDTDFYVSRERGYEEILPWDFIEIGVTKEYLISENEKAKRAALTPDCREGCTGCGINRKSFAKGECFEGAISNKVH